jgi:methionyl-tRNA synthetase
MSLAGNIHEQNWKTIGSILLDPGHKLGNIEPIFEKVDRDKIKEQGNKLNNR